MIDVIVQILVTPRPLYSKEGTPGTLWVGNRAGLDALEKRQNILHVLGIELRR
jgi:hypothetical protein